MRIILALVITIFNLTLFAQVQWPVSYKKNFINSFKVTQDNDGGYLTLCSFNNDGNSYLIKFDANGKLIWQKCLHYSKYPSLWGTSFVKDKFKNTYITGCTWDTDSSDGDAFIIKFDSCYKKTKCVVYTDTIDKYQQYFGNSYDFNDSLFFIEAWGFDSLGRNNFLLIDKNDLKFKRSYNSNAGSGVYSSLDYNGAVYLELSDYYHLKNDTTVDALRSFTMKLNKASCDIVFYKFFGNKEDMLSIGHSIFESHGQLLVFSLFLVMPDTNYPTLNPMMSFCDTNGNVSHFKIFKDNSIHQEINNVLKFNDSIYFLTLIYKELNSTGDSYKIKFYKLKSDGSLMDSFYMNNWGRKFFYRPEGDFIRLMKTSSNKIMCFFNEKDTFGSNSRLTFIRFDENFNLDTTEFRNSIYDAGCSVQNDTISLDGYKLIDLKTDSIADELKLTNPKGIIIVPNKAKAAFFPNPVTDLARFEFENTEPGLFKVILNDSRGGLVRELYNDPESSCGTKQLNFDFSNLAQGLYYISVYTDAGLIHTIRIVKE
jgi:hypothetical protein